LRSFVSVLRTVLSINRVRSAAVGNWRPKTSTTRSVRREVLTPCG